MIFTFLIRRSAIKAFEASLLSILLSPLSTFAAGTEVDGEKLTHEIVTMAAETTRSLGFQILPFPGTAYRQNPYFKGTHPGILQELFIDGVAWKSQEDTNLVFNCESSSGSNRVQVEEAEGSNFVDITKPRNRVILCGGLVASLKFQSKNGSTPSEMRGFVAQEIVREVFLHVQNEDKERVPEELVTQVVCESEHSSLYADYCDKKLGTSLRPLDH